MTRTRLRTVVAGLVIVAFAAVGCSSGSEKSSVVPGELLGLAKSTLDGAAAVHVVASGKDFPTSGSYLRSAAGDAVHPDNFAGELGLHLSGFDITVPAVSIGGKFYAKLPGGGSTYSVVDPSSYGVSDPGKLISTANGLSSLLAATKNPKWAGQSRAGAEVLEKITGTLPAALVGSLLTIADPAATVDATFAINASTHQLRWAELAGPFYDEAIRTTYRLTLTDYGKAVDISAPATG